MAAIRPTPNDPLAHPRAQLCLFANIPVPLCIATQAANGVALWRVGYRMDVLQINVGRRGNQPCHHCNVADGPNRRAMMTPKMTRASTEMVQQAGELSRHVIDHCNSAMCTALLCRTACRNHRLPTRPRSRQHRWSTQRRCLCQGGAILWIMVNSTADCNSSDHRRDRFTPGRTSRRSRNAPAPRTSQHYGIVFNRLCTLMNMPIGPYLAFAQAWTTQRLFAITGAVV
ncbi:hypothetical protein [Chloroflexus sp.]|uniref:hypothetical protein n=1 Tax=Chloroflexus sp. TaxID=1904827 RepID=UPI003C70E186